MADIISNINSILGNLFKKPDIVPSDSLKRDPNVMSDKDKELFQKLGVSYSQLSNVISKAISVNYERQSLYAEATRALTHPLIGAAMELYTNSSCGYSQLQNASVWVTSENKKYQNVLMSLFDEIGLEEKIADWTWNTGSLGDLFIQPVIIPGKGIVSVDDTEHPIDVSRIDFNGRLLGFYHTPLGSTGGDQKLLEPWQYVHFRRLGARVKRPFNEDFTSVGYRSISLLASDTRRATSKYGDSLLTNALPIYKRLRLSEDCLLMARVAKAVTKYIYKLKVDGNNNEAIASIIDNYTTVLKRLRSQDITPGSEKFKDVLSDLTFLEDIIIPVWGDINNLGVEKIGGDIDIKYVVDIEELRNQLAVALRTPLPLLGGYTKEMNGALGQSSAERLDIRFAKAAHSLQRTMVEGIYRLCQIHLAFLGMDPDVRLFDIHMAETSSAEEEELVNSLNTKVDVVQKLAELIMQYSPDIDRDEFFNYLNTKILKLNDLDLSKMKQSLREKKVPIGEGIVLPSKVHNTDIKALLPNAGGKAIWESRYKNTKLHFSEKKHGIDVKIKGMKGLQD